MLSQNLELASQIALCSHTVNPATNNRNQRHVPSLLTILYPMPEFILFAISFVAPCHVSATLPDNVVLVTVPWVNFL
jgi:hypothetical protein